MYYDKILRVWVIDLLDYFLISALIGSLLAFYAKNYQSEDAAMKRLKNSIIKESLLISAKPIPVNSKTYKSGSKRSLKIALEIKGGQQKDIISEADLYKLALEIKKIVEKLAAYLKERELTGFLRIFFKGGRLVLDLILQKCDINITYETFNRGVKTQVIVYTIAAGGASGFTASWYSVGATIVVPSVLAALLFTRSVMQQIDNYMAYRRFKTILMRLLDDPELQKRLQTYFTDGNARTQPPSSGQMEFQPLGSDTNPESASGEDLDTRIKQKMKEEYGLIENPTDSQLEKIISDKLKGGANQLNASFVQQRLATALSFPFTLVASNHPFWELFPSIPDHLRWIIVLSFTRLTLNRVWFIVWILIMLEEIEQMLKRGEELYRILKLKKQALISRLKISLPSLLNKNDTTQETTQKQLASIKTALIIDLDSILNDLNNPLFQFIRVSKLYDVFYTKKTVSTFKKNFLSSKKKFVASKITNVRTKITKWKPQIKVKKVISLDFVSSCLGYGSLGMAALTAVFRQDYYESECKKLISDFQSGARIERSIEEFQDSNAPQLASNSSSKTPRILFPGDYFGKPYIVLIQGKSAEEVDLPQSKKSPQFEIETFIEYEEEVPSTTGSSPTAVNGNNPIVTSDSIVSEPIIIEIETDAGSGPINMNQ